MKIIVIVSLAHINMTNEEHLDLYICSNNIFIQLIKNTEKNMKFNGKLYNVLKYDDHSLSKLVSIEIFFTQLKDNFYIFCFIQFWYIEIDESWRQQNVYFIVYLHINAPYISSSSTQSIILFRSFVCFYFYFFVWL